MKREELILVAQKKILENAHNPAAPAVVQIWQDNALPTSFPIAVEYLGLRVNHSTGTMQHVYNLDAREVLKNCEGK
ncbi:MAG: hypothetical protein ACRC2V_18835 [Xenococcaceae cyanobacterium]